MKLVVCIVMTCLAGLNATASDDNDSLKRRVLAEYPSALAKMEKEFSQVKGSGKYAKYMGMDSNDPVTWTFDVTFARDNEMRRFTRAWNGAQKLAGKPVEEVWCTNSDYAFTLKRDTDSRPLLIRYVGSDHDSIREDMNIWVERYLEGAYSILGTHISQLLNEPTFQLKDVEEVVTEQHKLFRINYDLRPDDLIFREGWILVSPDDGWRLQSFASQLKEGFDGTVLTGDVEYDSTSTGIPTPKSVTIQLGAHTKDRFDFDKIVRGRVAKNEFTLSAFGLSEIAGSRGKSYRSRALYWVLGLAATSLLISLILKYAAHRRAKA